MTTDMHILTKVHERSGSTKYIQKDLKCIENFGGKFLGKVHMEKQAHRKILQD
jgi:hypothetical protein